MREGIYEELKRVAKAESYTTYAKISPLAGLDMGNQADRNEIAKILGDISTHEHSSQHPLLSAVVVLAEEGKPGQGFFTLARDLGLYEGGDDLKFWLDEIKRVHQYWTSASTRQ